MTERPRVAIVGAGFGGLWATRAFAGKPVDVLLFDENNYHAFWPLLYQVAAAEIEAEQIAHPLRRILRKQDNVTFVMDRVHAVDFDARTLGAGPQTFSFDYLILALGSASTFFGIEGASEHALPLKTMEDAIGLRNRILRCFECAQRERGDEQRRRYLTFVVVGGGPTGVEFAGALSELVYGPLAKDYRGRHIDEVQIVLVEMLDRLLAAMPEELGDYALEHLRGRHVDVRLETAVARVTADAVYFEDGSYLDTETVVWTAGVQGAPLGAAWGLEVTRGNRVIVEPSLQIPGCPQVYAIGDMAHFEDEDGQPLPMLAQPAMQQGEHAAANILRQIRGEPVQPFHYDDKGVMATVGRNAAVARIFGVAFTGFFAWIIWLAVHLFQLIGFRNRIMVLVNWAWSYIFFERVVRLILPRVRELEEVGEQEFVHGET